VRATDSCFERTDTFNLTILPYQDINIGNDSTICEGVSTVLKNHFNNVPGSSFLWSNGSTDSILTINTKGTYRLTINQGNCSVSDTININTKPFPIVDIGNDTTICVGTNITLRCNPQNPGVKYLWSTGSVSEQTQTQGPGKYTITVTDNDCKTNDAITVGYMPAPYISLGGDIDTCFPQGISLPNGLIKGIGYSFLWNTGSTDSAMYITKPGFYKVQLTNVCGVATDSMNFNQHNCKIWFPNAFSPNGDGHNDFIKLLGDIKGVSRFDVIIYNRWGQNVYRSSNPYDGWDGTQKGQPCEIGTYYYMLRVVYNRKEEVMKGGIELVR
jgi:gliding motility-associated-like protein